MKNWPLAPRLAFLFAVAAFLPVGVFFAFDSLRLLSNPFAAAALALTFFTTAAFGVWLASRFALNIQRLENRLAQVLKGGAAAETPKEAAAGPELKTLWEKVEQAARAFDARTEAEKPESSPTVLPDERTAKQQQVEAFLRGIGDGVSIVDKDMRIIYVNDAVRDIFGDHTGEFCFNVYEHKKEICAGCPVQKAMETGEIQHSLRRVYDKHGNLLYYESTGSPIRDDREEIIAGLELTRDVTQRIKLERNVEIRSRQLAAANAQLRRANEQIQSAFEELKTAQIQLVHSEKMASLGVLVAGIAHEINNPLNFVSASIKMLAEHVSSLMGLLEAYEKLEMPPDARDTIGHLKEELEMEYLAEDVDKMVKSISTGAERMAQIVQNLRTFSRLDSTRREDVNIQEGLESTLQILHHQYKDRITIERDYHPIPLISGNPGQLNQVFMNILHNAIQAIDGKGAIRISVHLVGDRVRISIADTGAGIDAEDLKHVFDPFFTTKKVGEGTGLGLSISYGIVEGHGGKLWAESTKGAGTVFHIELPAAQEKEMARGA